MNIHGTISTIIIMNIPITPKIFLIPDWTSPNGATNIRLLSCPRLD